MGQAIPSAKEFGNCADWDSGHASLPDRILAAGNGRKLARCKPRGAKKENQMKMKASLLVGAFSLALFMAGCTAAPAAAPVAGPAGPQGDTGATGATGNPGQDADRRRADDDKRAEEARRAEDQRITDARTRDSRDTGCPSGEHVVTAPDGRKSCGRD